MCFSIEMARIALTVNTENASMEELEASVKCARTERESSRYRAIIALEMGFDRKSVAKLFGVGERALRNWIKAFNKQGIDGLLEEPREGRPSKIPAQTHEELREVLTHPEQANEVHWTGVKFHGYIRETLEIEIGYSTVIRFLHDQSFALKVPRPWPDRQDEKAREAFCEGLKRLLENPDVEFWFGDECGVEGDPRPRRRWAVKGSKTRGTKNGDHVRMNITGIICPRTGEAYALEFTHSDTEVFQCFLDEANQDLRFERKRQILILDNASWHKGSNLRWGRFEPMFLPPYSPDLNPIERLWLIMKAEWFTDFVARTREELMERLDLALCWLMDRQEGNQRTCAMKTEI
jgi:transposase